MDDKIAAMKEIFLSLGGDEDAWEHIEMHIKQAIPAADDAGDDDGEKS